MKDLPGFFSFLLLNEPFFLFLIIKVFLGMLSYCS